MNSENLYNLAKQYFPGGVNSPVRYYAPYPIFMSRGYGSKIYDVDNKEYIDYCLGFGPLILGHSNERVKEKMKEAMDRSWLLGTPTEYEINLAKLIRAGIPNLKLMRFTNSGTEATMHVIRVARAFTNKMKIIKVLGGYHGAHDSVLAKAGSGAVSIPSSPGIPEEVTKNTLLVDYNNIAKLEEIINKNKNSIAAMILEPVLGNIGVITPDNDYLAQVRELTEKNDILLIFDEVITGFRNRFGSVQDHFKVYADLITLGKIIGGGLPIGAFGGRDDIMKKISPEGNVYEAGTFSGNPLSIIAGTETLSILKEQDYSILNNNAELLTQKISNELNIAINRFGSMYQIFFRTEPVRDYATAMKADATKFFKFFKLLLKEGIYLPPSQYETNFLSFAHTNKDLEFTSAAMIKAIEMINNDNGSKRQ